MGLLTPAYPAARSDLERATARVRLFREQPTPELARDARMGLASAISPNERLQLLYHPWTSYVIVPLFALANAGLVVSAPFLARAFTSPVTLGILAGYVVGKPVGTAGASWLVTTVSRGRVRPPAGWASVIGAGTIAGIGVTVSLLVASLAYHGEQLAEAKAGVLAAAIVAAALTWAVFRVTSLLPPPVRLRALLGQSTAIVDLRGPRRGGRGHRRPERRLRHAYLLHQRAAAPGRLRHRVPGAGRAAGAGGGGGHRVGPAGPPGSQQCDRAGTVCPRARGIAGRRSLVDHCEEPLV